MVGRVALEERAFSTGRRPEHPAMEEADWRSLNLADE
jgi:hypothetical protein